MRRLTLEYTLAGVVGALAAADIRSLVLKGPAFAHWLYDHPSERSYQDFDLLLAPAAVAAAGAVLATRGFKPLPEGTHEHERTHHESWQRAETPAVTVELHHTLPLVGATPELLWERFSAGRLTLAIAGGSVETPGLAASALLVALHAAWHRDDSAKPRVDLARALGRLDEPAWRAAAALAKELDAEPGFVAGLAKVPGGRTLIDDLGLGATRLPRSLRLLEGGPAPQTAAGVEQLLTTPGVRGRGRLLALKLVPSPGFMRAAYPLATRGRAGLAAAYVRRPLELLIHLPAGLAAWVRVARDRGSAPTASPSRARARARARRR